MTQVGDWIKRATDDTPATMIGKYVVPSGKAMRHANEYAASMGYPLPYPMLGELVPKDGATETKSVGMTQEQMCQWLGFPAGTALRQEIIDALAPLPFPQTDAEHIAAFRAFLRVAGKPAIVRRDDVQG